MGNNKKAVRNSVGFLANLAGTAFQRHLFRAFRKSGCFITVEQFTVLMYLWGEEGKTQQQIACCTNRDKPSITRLLDNMERNELVVRVPCQKDRRVKRIFLTTKAKELKYESMRLTEQSLQEALVGIPETDLCVCKEVLGRIVENLACDA